MYRLLIVDDEPIIADVLYDLFLNLKEPEFDLYRAYCGEAALAVIRKARMDIVLTDICMPDISGLEIQKEIRMRWPDCKVIFLTGFNDFDYIQSAMRNEGSDYILKTEDDEVIIQAVLKAVEKIDEERRNVQLVEKAKRNMVKALPLLQEKYLGSLVQGMECSAEERKEQFSELGVPLQAEQPVMMLVGKVDGWADRISAVERMKTVYGIKDTVNEHLKTLCSSTAVIFDYNRLLWLIQPFDPIWIPDGTETADTGWNTLLRAVHENMDSMQQTCRELFGVYVSFISTERPVEWGQVSSRFDTLKLGLEKALGIGSEMLLIDHETHLGNDGMGEENGDPDENLAYARLKKLPVLEEFLENGRKDEFDRLLDDILDAGRSANFMSDYLNREIYFRIAAVFMTYINRRKLNDRLKERISLDRLASMEAHASWAAVKSYFRELADQILQQADSDSFTHVNRIFGFIRNHAAQNLDGDLSLTRFAELLHFHPFYLSRLFKQVAGKSLSDYIWEVKLAKARELLKQGDMKIGEIASSLGFENASYFTRFFRRYTDMSPQEYRSLFTE